MANKSINTLDETTSLANADLLVLWKASANAAYSISGQSFTTMLTTLAEGHGGIDTITWTTSGTSGDGQYHYATIHYADTSTSTFTIRDGVKGDTGAQTYVWLRYSDGTNDGADPPNADNQIGVIPAPWLGIYVGLSNTAPTSYSAYTWYKIKGDKGDTGESISRVVKSSTVGLTDYYTMYTDENTNVGSFTVTNGQGGVSTVNENAPDGDGNVDTIVRSVEDLTLNGTALVSGSATISDAYSALLQTKILMCPLADFASGQRPNSQSTAGTITIFKGNSVDESWIAAHGDTYGYGDYHMYFASGSPSGMWCKDVHYETIWENTNPTATFGAQDILVDISPYRAVMIAFLGSAIEQVDITQFGLKGTWGRVEAMLNMTYGSGVITAAAQRVYAVLTDNRGVYFQDCVVRGSIGSSTAPDVINTCLIPQYIIGIT